MPKSKLERLVAVTTATSYNVELTLGPGAEVTMKRSEGGHSSLYVRYYGGKSTRLPLPVYDTQQALCSQETLPVQQKTIAHLKGRCSFITPEYIETWQRMFDIAAETLARFNESVHDNFYPVRKISSFAPQVHEVISKIIGAAGNLLTFGYARWSIQRQVDTFSSQFVAWSLLSHGASASAGDFSLNADFLHAHGENDLAAECGRLATYYHELSTYAQQAAQRQQRSLSGYHQDLTLIGLRPQLPDLAVLVKCLIDNSTIHLNPQRDAVL